MYKCKVCSKEFELQKKIHYIARNAGKSGLAALAGGNEETLYDTFDCPHCGCQNIMQERKRSYMNVENVDEEETIDNEEHEKCFGQYAGYVDCITCDEEKECLAEYTRSKVFEDEKIEEEQGDGKDK